MVSPFFQFEYTEVTAEEDSEDGSVRSGDHLKIELEDHALRIKAPSFGKTVTLDGHIYQASEIVFKTPAEHTIDGKEFEMEMQVIHVGKTDQDMAKSVTLCFLFKKKPGASNKFLESLEIFNLPNYVEKYREINNKLFVPNVFLMDDEEELGVSEPFSFYTYQGSLTQPPCNERTIMYVASKPIETSVYSIQLFKEALQVADGVNRLGEMLYKNQDNNRAIQNLNGRSIFHFDSSDCLFDRKRKGAAKKQGHYEKVPKKAVSYFYVNTPKPSGLPNAWVVTEREALGPQSDQEKEDEEMNEEREKDKEDDD